MPEATEEILKHIGDLDDELLGGDEKARELPRALVGGVNAMRAGVAPPSPLDPGANQTEAWARSCTRWLPPERAERESEYRERVWRSYLYPFYNDAIDLNVGRVFAKSPTLVEPDSRIEEISESISLTGDHWTQVARDRFWKGIDDGVSFILVDYPQVPKGRDTLATDATARPYWVSIDAGQVLGLAVQVVGSSVRLVEFRYLEKTHERDGLKTRCVERVRWFRAGSPGADAGDGRPAVPATPPTLRTFVKDGDKWLPEAETPIQRPNIPGESPEVKAIEDAYFIPIVPVYGRRVGPYRGRPYFRDLADLNLQHFQKKSDIDRILHVGQVPVLFGSGLADDGKAEIGPYRMIKTSAENAKLAYVEPAGSMVQHAREDLHDLEARLTIASLEPLTRRASGSETATEKLIDEAKGHSVLSALAMGLQDSLENAFKFTANWLGMADGPAVSVNTDFGISMRDAAELQVLTNAVLAGKVSTETYLTELRRRGLLSEEVDVQAELEAIDREGPALGEVGAEDDEEAAA